MFVDLSNLMTLYSMLHLKYFILKTGREVRRGGGGRERERRYRRAPLAELLLLLFNAREIRTVNSSEMSSPPSGKGSTEAR